MHSTFQHIHVHPEYPWGKDDHLYGVKNDETPIRNVIHL